MAGPGFNVNLKKLNDFTTSMKHLESGIKHDLQTQTLPRQHVSLGADTLDFGQSLPDFTAAVSLAKDYTDAVNALFDRELPEYANALAVLGEAVAAIADAYTHAEKADAVSAKSIDDAINEAPMPTSAYGV